MNDMDSGFRQFIEQVREANDIVGLIGEDVTLSGSSRMLKGLSPFRNEKNPSFCVWPKDQRWHDFGGEGSGGDVFSYVQRRDNIDFKEALFQLAERRGIRRPNQDDEAYKKEIALLLERREVQQLLTKAAAQYHGMLPSHVRQKYYREHYEFTDETIDELMLGYSSGNLYEYFRNDLGVSEQLALKTGLFVIVKGGKIEDFFVDRLVFPYWKNGQVAYFIARATQYTGDEEWEKSKYKKLLTHSEKHQYVSPAVCNDTFFSEDAARGAEEILVTEGITDAISARQAGIAVISPVTTRFRKRDIPKLLNLTKSAKRVIICNDAEENGAGAAGAMETASELFGQGRDVRIAVLPRPEGIEKVDVNEFLKANPPEVFRQILSDAKRYVEYLIEAVDKNTPLLELGSKLKPILQAVNRCEELERDAYIKIIVDKFRIKERTVTNKLKKIADEQKRKAKAEAKNKPRDYPVIQINGRQLRDILNDARTVSVNANMERIQAGAANLPTQTSLPLLFRRAGDVVRLTIQESASPELSEWSETSMFGLLVRDADWVTVDNDGDEHPATPPKDVSRDLVAYPPEGYPQVDSVITTPVFSKDGKLIVKPGLHANDKLWLQLDARLSLPEVPQNPTSDDVAYAKAMFLDELFVDFPFVSDSDRAHMMAAVLLPFVMRMIRGNTPLHILESPDNGSGKTLLCHLTSIVCTGNSAQIGTLPGEEEEVRKTVTAELIKAGPMIVLDNAKEKRITGSQALASVLTAPIWSNRLLGESKMVSVPNLAMWMLTGTNLEMTKELTRRSVRIRIDPKVERAWQRKGFKHDPVTEWATEHRSELVHAALVLVQAWIAAGMPRSDKRLGSFESWAAIIGGILQVIEVPDFLENLNDMYDNNDSESDSWQEFVQTWWAELGAEYKRVNELNELCEDKGLMLKTRGDGKERSQQVRLGKALLGARDRIFDGLKLVAERTRHKSRQYALQNLSYTPPQHSEPVCEEVDPWA